jgi:hypothetical protein
MANQREASGGDAQAFGLEGPSISCEASESTEGTSPPSQRRFETVLYLRHDGDYGLVEPG